MRVLQLAEEQREEFIAVLEAASAEKGPWHEMPMDTTVRALLHGGVAKVPRFWDDYSTALMAPVEEGYWFFLDRHSQAEDPWDTNAFTERKDYHFTLAVYDSATGKLWCFTMDTPE